MKQLEEARKTLKLAFEELERYRRDREFLRLRNACEECWLAIVLAIIGNLKVIVREG